MPPRYLHERLSGSAPWRDSEHLSSRPQPTSWKAQLYQNLQLRYYNMKYSTTAALAALYVLLFSLAGLGEARRVGCADSDSQRSSSLSDASSPSGLSSVNAVTSGDYGDSAWHEQDALLWPSRISARLSADSVNAQQLSTGKKNGTPLKTRASKTLAVRDLDTRPTPEPTGASSSSTMVHITDEHDFALLLPNRSQGTCSVG